MIKVLILHGFGCIIVDKASGIAWDKVDISCQSKQKP